MTNARSEYHTQLAKMSFDEIFDLTAGVYFNFYSILQVPTTQLAKMIIDPKSELTADVLEIFLLNTFFIY